MAALTLGMAAVFALLVVDSGRLYLEQRKLQRVVDMAALEAAGQSAVCSGPGANALAQATVSARRNGFDPAQEHGFQVSCGSVQTGAQSLRAFTPDNSRADAIRVVAQREVPTSIAVNLFNLVSANGLAANTVLQARAIATPPLPPLAALSIRSNLLNIDSNRSALLNALFSKLLGGNLNISALGWESLLNTDLNLLNFLQALNLKAGSFEQLLSTELKVTDLVQAMINVAGQSSPLVEASLKNLLQASVNAPNVVLGKIITLQSGTPSAGLDTNVQLLELVQAVIQLAGKQNAVVVDATSINIPGLLNIGLKLGVVEPPQLSSIGNPAKAKLNPTGPDQIFVRTAQVRLMLSVKLPVLDLVNNALSAVNGLVSPLAGALNGLLRLNLVETLSSVLCLLGTGCDMIDPQILPGAPSLDINVEVASGSSRVTDFTCTPDKTLTTQTKTSALTLKVGTIANKDAAFSSSVVPTVTPLPVVDIGIKTCHRILGLLGTCGPRVPFAGGGLGLLIDSSVASNSDINGVTTPLIFSPPTHSPPNLDQPAAILSLNNPKIVNGLKTALGGIKIQAFESPKPNLLSNLLNVTASILSAVNDTLGKAITSLLSPLVDPLLDSVLKTLGISLNQIDVGANLQCGGRPSLVL